MIESDDETICSLEGLVDEGITARFQHSFYAYSGSMSQPRCSVDVHRVIMYETIEVNEDLFMNLKQKVMDGYPEKENFRLPRNFNTKSMSSY